MLKAIMLNVTFLSVILLGVAMLSVMALAVGLKWTAFHSNSTLTTFFSVMQGFADFYLTNKLVFLLLYTSTQSGINTGKDF
jgi:hypothetical protein